MYQRCFNGQLALMTFAHVGHFGHAHTFMVTGPTTEWKIKVSNSSPEPICYGVYNYSNDIHDVSR